MSNFKKAKTGPSAGEKIEAIEKAIVSVKNMIKVMAEEMDKLQQAQTMLSRQIEGILKVAPESEINEKRVSDFVMDQQLKELKNQIEVLVSNGVLSKTEEIVDEKIFIVGKEITKEGEVVTPRLQASISSLPEQVKTALKNKKVGDLVDFGENQLNFQIDEVYKITELQEKNTNLEVSV
jgi:hypothetical protein